MGLTSLLYWNNSPLAVLLVSMLCGTPLNLSISPPQVAPSGQADVASSNPILPGDHPDPTVIRVGDTYWTTSTAGNWAPEFALYRSADLHHWKAVSAVFPHTPKWASGDFWAPELVNDNGHILVYYVARNRETHSLCVAVATASRPEGPYTDHGTLQCQPDGSIDPAFARDENGIPYLIWKEDGNSINRPTILWAQPLTADLVHLTGSKTQLLVNDPYSWEGGVVEAPDVMRHDNHFYLFYAANSCCGTGCRYAEGVARADHLLGHYEKDPDNPIIRPNGNWKCPGHGDAIETPSGEDYFLYHAYPAQGTVYVGRESVLDRMTWNASGWPVINGGQGPAGGVGPTAESFARLSFMDDLNHLPLDPEWKWPIGDAPTLEIGNGKLVLSGASKDAPAVLVRSLLAPAYTASVTLLSGGEGQGGLGIFGNLKNFVVLGRKGNSLEIVRDLNGKVTIGVRIHINPHVPLHLRVSSNSNGEALFDYSLDGAHWHAAKASFHLGEIIPWDQGLRVGLMVLGLPSARASFGHFSLTSEQTTGKR